MNLPLTLDEIRKLRGKHLVAYAKSCWWYVKPNDLVGGWSVMPGDFYPSDGCWEIASCFSLATAEEIVRLHNREVSAEAIFADLSVPCTLVCDCEECSNER